MIKVQRVMPLVMATIMSFMMSGIMTYLHIAETSHFFKAWLQTWLFVWPCAIILASIVSPSAAKISVKVTNTINRILPN